MKQRNLKALYEEPTTTVAHVVLEGFLCASIRAGMEVDEIVNKNVNSSEVFGLEL